MSAIPLKTTAATAPGQSLRETALVIRREILTRAANRTIALTTALLALGVGAACGISAWLLGNTTQGLESFNLNPKLLFATAMICALLTSLVYSSQSLTTGVVEEKSSRVVEILLTKIGIGPLLAGKLIGIGVVTLAQLLVIGGAAITGFTLLGGFSLIDIELGPTLLWFMVWFLLGYAIFALLNTALAATVARQEDLASAVMPLSVLQMVLLVLALYVLPTNLDNGWLHALSFVPLFSSYLMPIRYGLGEVDIWQMAVAVWVALVSIPLLFKLSTMLYRNNALRTGSRVSLRASLSSDNDA